MLPLMDSLPDTVSELSVSNAITLSSVPDAIQALKRKRQFAEFPIISKRAKQTGTVIRKNDCALRSDQADGVAMRTPKMLTNRKANQGVTKTSLSESPGAGRIRAAPTARSTERIVRSRPASVVRPVAFKTPIAITGMRKSGTACCERGEKVVIMSSRIFTFGELDLHAPCLR